MNEETNVEKRVEPMSARESGYVAILECAEGNAEVGNMMVETFIINGKTTVDEIMYWKEKRSGNHGRLMISKAT